jgi:hypothetical protein
MTEATRVTAQTPGQAAYEAYRAAVFSSMPKWGELSHQAKGGWEAAAQAAVKASDVTDDFHFERKQVVELRAVLGEVFTCLDAGDPSLLDDEQVTEWRERSGLEAAP